MSRRRLTRGTRLKCTLWCGTPERMSVDELPDPEPVAGEMLLEPAAERA